MLLDRCQLEGLGFGDEVTAYLRDHNCSSINHSEEGNWVSVVSPAQANACGNILEVMAPWGTFWSGWPPGEPPGGGGEPPGGGEEPPGGGGEPPGGDGEPGCWGHMSSCETWAGYLASLGFRVCEIIRVGPCKEL